MLSALLGWIPVLGPIIQGITSIASGVFGVETAKVNADVEIAKVSAQIIHDTNDDISLRLLRDIAITPVVVWSMLIGWDTIISGRDRLGTLYHPDLAQFIWHTPDYPVSVGYIPYVVFAFLFGNIGFNIWKRYK